MSRTIKQAFKTYGLKPLEDLYWCLYGAGFKQPALPANPRAILFVCQGNVCRSVFAHFYAQKIVGRNGGSSLTFESAGLDVKKTMAPPSQAHQAAEMYDIHFNGHLSKPITINMVQAHEMVLAMEVRQLKSLIERFPDSRARFFLLPVFDPLPAVHPQRRAWFNIDDPFNKDLTYFFSCYEHIARCTQELLRQLNVSTMNDKKDVV